MNQSSETKGVNISSRNFRPELKRALRIYAAKVGVKQEEALNIVVETGLRALGQLPPVAVPPVPLAEVQKGNV